MLYPLWTAKSGAGCSTTALALAIDRARRDGDDVLLVDLGGDLAAVAGVPDRPDGLTDWLAAPAAVETALSRLEVPLSPRLSLLPRGSASSWPADRGELLHRLMLHDARTVVVDVGEVATPDSCMQVLRRRFADGEPSWLVTRPCYLAMRRVQGVGVRPTGVILVQEPGRSLDRFVVADVVGAPVLALIDHDPAVARAVDAGLLLSRSPRPLRRQVRSLVR